MAPDPSERRRKGVHPTRARALSLPALILSLAAFQTGERTPFEDWYPKDISPPPGTRYPCALTPLPRKLEGVPESERRYINHTYTLILRATQEKLRLLKALDENAENARVEEALARYQSATRGLASQIDEEETPTGLEPFEADVLEALRLQSEFFRRGALLRVDGAGMTEIFRIPEGRKASSLLHRAWTKMRERYPRWTKETSDSVFHHLCALDLF